MIIRSVLYVEKLQLVQKEVFPNENSALELEQL